MNISLEQLRTLVEGGDQAALESYIKSGLEKSDMPSVLETNKDIKSYFDAEKDTHHSKALETWKSNHLQGLIDEAVKAANPEETPEQKRIRELEEKIANSEKAAALSKLKESALKYATAQGFNAEFASKYVERFLGDDETSTQTTLDDFKKDLDDLIQTQVKETLKKDSTRHVGGGTGGAGTETSYGAKLAGQTNATQTAVEAQQHYFK